MDRLLVPSQRTDVRVWLAGRRAYLTRYPQTRSTITGHSKEKGCGPRYKGQMLRIVGRRAEKHIEGRQPQDKTRHVFYCYCVCIHETLIKTFVRWQGGTYYANKDATTYMEKSSTSTGKIQVRFFFDIFLKGEKKNTDLYLSRFVLQNF